jgi:aryl-alcohol dehydrogenase-like predicted oxidoreductase
MQLPRNSEIELIHCYRRYEIEIHNFTPLAKSFLSGKYTASAAPAEGRFSDNLSSQGKMSRDHISNQASLMH